MTAKKKRSRKPVGDEAAEVRAEVEVSAEVTEDAEETPEAAEVHEDAEVTPEAAEVHEDATEKAYKTDTPEDVDEATAGGETDDDGSAGGGDDGDGSDGDGDEDSTAEEGETGPSLWQRVRPYAVIATSVYLLLAVIWILTGSMTTGPNMCADCHKHSVHEAAGATDPHFGVACVNCHEPGGWVARFTSNVPMRMQHFLEAQSGSVRSQPFGQKVSSAGCAECHKKDMEGTLYDPTRAVSMSHKEPVEVGAECMDCHIFKGGEISAGTSGMANCIRCHDGKVAKAECGVCHQGDPTDADLPEISPKKLRSRLVPTPNCMSCHDASACRECHEDTLPRPSK